MQVQIGDAVMHQGEALAAMKAMDDNSVDAILTDPPYSSGGLSTPARQRPPSEKYQNTGTKRAYEEFLGDGRDQRSYLVWATLWLTEAYRVAKPGTVCMMFTDWRQLPVLSDALQAGGWIWRTIVVWDKPSARPTVGDFRRQCEFVLVGSKGKFAPVHNRCLPGVFRHCVISGAQRLHMTEKPIPLLRDLLQVTPEGGTVLDPFAGSATTAQACLETGRKFIGVELSEAYFNTACDRLKGLVTWTM